MPFKFYASGFFLNIQRVISINTWDWNSGSSDNYTFHFWLLWNLSLPPYRWLLSWCISLAARQCLSLWVWLTHGVSSLRRKENHIPRATVMSQTYLLPTPPVVTCCVVLRIPRDGLIDGPLASASWSGLHWLKCCSLLHTWYVWYDLYSLPGPRWTRHYETKSSQE